MNLCFCRYPELFDTNYVFATLTVQRKIKMAIDILFCLGGRLMTSHNSTDDACSGDSNMLAK